MAVSTGQMLAIDIAANGPMANVHINHLKYECEKELSGTVLARLKVVVMSASNIVYSVACLVKDLFLTIIAGVAAIFGQEGRNFLRVQIGHAIEDIAAIPASIIGMIVPEAGHDFATSVQRVVVENLADVDQS